MYQQLQSKEVIYIGWNRCKFTEDLGIIRCFNCNGYGYVANKCQREATCPICLANHKISECKREEKKCINCREANRKLNRKLNVEHTVFNGECAVLKRISDIQRLNYINTRKV